ncbi:putative polysaccharide biosynthesis protein [Anaerotalea alkaliphila]|uniref:Polysaccharide biosynthesis protein n=1 Tax=Anaerotalea alkaliphila TaxID=2662126 RepID=A0A7X5HWZ6_9FIRM|nr:polysaccharide biosynthesis protein [Anaerotalea alkaliphila]NDL68153.1 polysaccharide biosynthesis protein [Anaerotalea alkaliphila]
MERTKKRNSLVMQGAILAAASLIVRLIGFAYRIPMVHLLKDEGMGYYSNSFDLYTFFLIISSYGLPAAISKIVSARYTRHQYREAHLIFRAGLALSLLIGTVSSVLLWASASWTADRIGSPLSVHAIRALAPALLIFALMAVFRGYFQGMNTMMPTALSQIVEQVFNAVFSLVLAGILVTKGMEYGASGGTMGTGVGALAGLLLLGGVYAMARGRILGRVEKDTVSDRGRMLSYWKVILLTAVPMVIGTVTFHMTNLVDMVMFQNALLFQGYDNTTTVTMYGILNGKYKLMVTLPVSIASALATASIPSITASLVRGDKEDIRNKVDQAIRTIMLFSIPSAVGLFVLARPILQMLFGTENLETAASLLRLGSVSVVFFGISTISIGILQGLNLLRVPVVSSAKSLGIKVAFNILLLYVFDMNLYGAVITNIIFALSSAWLNLRAIHRHHPLGLNLQKSLILPGASALGMGIVSWLAYQGLMGLGAGNTWSTLAALPVAGLVYATLLLKTKVFTYEEVLELPKGHKLAPFLRRIGLLAAPARL